MITLKRILLPSDFSEYSAHAARYACELAAKFGAELHMLHVLQDLVTMVPEAGFGFIPGDYQQEMKQAAETGLAKALEPHWQQELSVVRETRQGVPFLEIIRYAREADIDLIVLGTHGRTGLSHLLLGSVAEKIVRKAPCPVLTVRHPQHEFVMP